MQFINRVISLLPISLLLTLIVAGRVDTALAQQQTPADDVVRVDTALVQSAITVVDKKGKFVEGLDRKDFELVIDGKPRQIGFFERVTAGSEREAQLAQRNEPQPATARQPVDNSTVRGRTIIFFIDDLHLSLSSLTTTRRMIAHFLDTEISARDLVVIADARGQIGFLQQFTNNKEVLEAALARVTVQPSEERTAGMGNAPMSQFTAMTIENKPDSRQNNVMAVYVEECLKQSGSMGGDRRTALAMRFNCERLVRSNARAILTQTGMATERMYDSLESLMRSSARLPGRKLVFFVSDGFLSQGGPLGDNLSNRVRQITDAAQRANVVIYTIDARGLVSGTLDATNNLLPDANGRMAAIASTELLATQDALNALAEDSGGRALRNQNYFERWVEDVIDETSNYYVVAWRPSTEAEKDSKFRNVKISIAGRPDLVVRAPRGYVETPPSSETVRVTSGETPKSTATEIHDALKDSFPSKSLQTVLSLSHIDSPANGAILTSSFQIAAGSLDYGNDGKQPATVTLAGVILNDKGKIATSFQTQLKVEPIKSETGSSGIVYSHRAPLAPGIYQVRVAGSDERSGHVGSAMQFIVIPDLKTGQLRLSTLLVGEQVADAKNKEANVQFSVDHHFSRSDQVGYWIFIYNAKRDAGGATNLTAETQVLRDGKVVLSNSHKLRQESADPARIPYAADLSVKSLAPGSYNLRVRVVDTIAGGAATQTTNFVVQ